MTLFKQEQAWKQIDLAEAALNGYLLDDALKYVQNAIEIDPNNSEARLLLARVQLKLNNPKIVLSTLDAFDYEYPQMRNSPLTAILRIEALIKCERFQIALIVADKLAAEFNDDVRIQRLLAGLYLKLQYTDKAINALRRVVHLQPSDDCSKRLLADSLADRDPQTAADLLMKSAAANDESYIRLRASRLLRQCQRMRDAEDQIRQLLKQFPNDPLLLIEAGQLADEMGEDELAIDRFERAIRLNGDHIPTAIASIAITHMHAGRLHTAGRSWWRLTRRVPEDIQAWAGMLVCCHATRKHRLLGKAQNKLAKFSTPKQRQVLLSRLWHHSAAAVAQQNMSQPGKTQIQPPSPLRTLLQSATNALHKVAGEFGNRADVHYHMAACGESLNDIDTATRSVASALAINPNYAAAQRLSVRLQRRTRSAA